MGLGLYADRPDRIERVRLDKTPSPRTIHSRSPLSNQYSSPRGSPIQIDPPSQSHSPSPSQAQSQALSQAQQSPTKYPRPHLPLLLVQRPSQDSGYTHTHVQQPIIKQEEDEDQDQDRENIGKGAGFTSFTGLPPFSVLERPVGFRFPGGYSNLGLTGSTSVGGEQGTLIGDGNSNVNANTNVNANGYSGDSARSPFAGPSFSNSTQLQVGETSPGSPRRLARPKSTTRSTGTTTGTTTATTGTTTGTGSPGKQSPGSLFTRTELRFASPATSHSQPSPKNVQIVPPPRSGPGSSPPSTLFRPRPDSRAYGTGLEQDRIGQHRNVFERIPLRARSRSGEKELNRSGSTVSGGTTAAGSSSRFSSTNSIATISSLGANRSDRSLLHPEPEHQGSIVHTPITKSPIGSPFVYARPQLLHSRSLGDLKMAEPTSPGSRTRSPLAEKEQLEREDEEKSPRSIGSRGESPDLERSQRQVEEEHHRREDHLSRVLPPLRTNPEPPHLGSGPTSSAQSPPMTTTTTTVTSNTRQADSEADEARDAVGKTPVGFDFGARRHSLAVTAFTSPHGASTSLLNSSHSGAPNGNGSSSTNQENGRFGSIGPYQNAPANPSPLGPGASPIGSTTPTTNTTNALATSLGPRRASVTHLTSSSGLGLGNVVGGPGSFRKRKESHDRAAGYIDHPMHENGANGALPSPVSSSINAPPLPLGGPSSSSNSSSHNHNTSTSSSGTGNANSISSNNNVFQVPAPPVFSNPFGQSSSSASTSTDRSEPPAKRRGSAYDYRMSHLSLASAGSPPIGPGGEIGGNLPWFNPHDRRDSATSMYSNRSMASSMGGYGSSTTTYSMISDKTGGYAPPPYSHAGAYAMDSMQQHPASMQDPRGSASSIASTSTVVPNSGDYMDSVSPPLSDGMTRYSGQERQLSVGGLTANQAFNALPPDTKEALGGASYSRSPELRVSHKLAERKRRKEMRDLFDELRDQLPQDRGMKASKWEILSKAVDHIQSVKRHNADMCREIEALRREVETLRVSAAAAAAASGVAYGVPPSYPGPFNGYMAMPGYPPPPPGSMAPPQNVQQHQHQQQQQQQQQQQGQHQSVQKHHHQHQANQNESQSLHTRGPSS